MPECRAEQNPSEFDKMSLEQLELLLQRDFQAPDGEGIGTEAVLQITESIARRESSGPDVNAAWRRLQEQYLPRLEEIPSAHWNTAPTGHHAAGPQRHMRRTVCAALVLTALLAVMTATAYAKGGLRRIIAQWTDEIFTFVQVGDESAELPDLPAVPEESLSGSYEDLPSALAAIGVDIPAAPSWIPAEFILESINTDISPYFQVAYALYTRGEDTLVLNFIVQRDGSYTSWQKDPGAAEEFEAGGVTHFLMENAGRQTAVWVNGPLECGLSGNITREEMKRIIQSIYDGTL